MDPPRVPRKAGRKRNPEVLELKAEGKRLRAELKRSRALQANLERDRLSDVNEIFALQKRDWLGQVLPSLKFKHEIGSLSTNRRYDDYVPQSVKSWKSFREEVAGYDDERISDVCLLDPLDRALFTNGPVGTQPNATFVMAVALKYLCFGQYRYWVVDIQRYAPIRRGEGRESTRDSTEPTSGNSVAQDFASTPESIAADIVVRKGERAILVVDMKPPRSFAGNDNEVTNLVRSYGDKLGVQYLSHSECVHQLMSYMINSNVLYGILSSAEFTYFARRVQDNDSHHSSVEISEAISFDSKSPTLLEALFFMLDKSTMEVGSGTNYRFKEAVDPDSEEDAAEDASLKRKAKKGRTKTTSQTGSRKSPLIQSGKAVNYCELKDTAASNLHLERRPYSCQVWSGEIGIGFINGQRVAIKIARKYTEKAEALLREMTAYKMLEKYWGRYVPELVNYGTTSNGTLVFIATQFIDGSELWRRAPSEAECRAAEEALNGIHSSGMLHGDVHGANMMIGEGGVRFIDFGFSRFISDEADCSKELNQLRRLLQERILQENRTSTVTPS